MYWLRLCIRNICRSIASCAVYQCHTQGCAHCQSVSEGSINVYVQILAPNLHIVWHGAQHSLASALHNHCR